MKKMMLLPVMFAMVMLGGCSGYSNISQVDEKLKNSNLYTIRDSSRKGDTTTYYYYAYYGESFRQAGWYCWEFTCAKDGNILRKREYWIGSDKAFEEFRKNVSKTDSTKIEKKELTPPKEPIRSIPGIPSSGPTRIVTWDFATVKSAPGSNYSSIATVLKGDKLTIMEQAGEWVRVRLENGQEGWIRSEVFE